MNRYGSALYGTYLCQKKLCGNHFWQLEYFLWVRLLGIRIKWQEKTRDIS